jgi:recombination protein RecT
MYRGVIQLCIRSGQYATIHCSEIYRDELKSHNPITGEVKFNEPNTFKLRYSEKRTDGDVVGHYVYFKLITGFEKSDYMTRGEVMAHARRYSKAYQYDLKAGKKTSAWSTDPIAMGNKTVLLRCLKKYGVMSLEMQEMIQTDYDNFDMAQADAESDINKTMGSKPIDADVTDTPTAEEKPKAKRGRKPKAKTPDPEEPKPEPVPEFLDDNQTAEQTDDEPMYICRGKCGEKFAEPQERPKPGGGKMYVCPNCGSLNIEGLEPEENAS